MLRTVALYTTAIHLLPPPSSFCCCTFCHELCGVADENARVFRAPSHEKSPLFFLLFSQPWILWALVIKCTRVRAPCSLTHLYLPQAHLTTQGSRYGGYLRIDKITAKTSLPPKLVFDCIKTATNIRVNRRDFLVTPLDPSRISKVHTESSGGVMTCYAQVRKLCGWDMHAL